MELLTPVRLEISKRFMTALDVVSTGNFLVSTGAREGDLESSYQCHPRKQLYTAAGDSGCKRIRHILNGIALSVFYGGKN